MTKKFKKLSNIRKELVLVIIASMKALNFYRSKNFFIIIGFHIVHNYYGCPKFNQEVYVDKDDDYTLISNDMIMHKMPLLGLHTYC